MASAVALDSLTGRYPGNPFSADAAALRDRLTARSSVKLGVLLPSMRKAEPSAAKDVGGEVSRECSLRLERYGARPRAPDHGTGETRDTERDPLRLRRPRRASLRTSPRWWGSWAGIFPGSNVRRRGDERPRAPLVTPTANANGIAAIGEISSSRPTRITTPAGAPWPLRRDEQRGFRTLAVLAPSDTYARFLAEAFIREAARLGARLISVQWYQRGTSDMKPQLAAIRRAGMLEGADAKLSFGGKVKPSTLMKFADLGVPLKRIDSLMNRSSVISARQLLGSRARALLDSMEIPVVYDESRVDSLEYPVETIDGLYAPISGADEIGIVSSQIVYFHFQTQVLGSGEWDSFAELNANRRYADGIVFESDTCIDTTGGAYGEFADSFAVRFGKKPFEKRSLRYDTADMMLRLIGNGAATREALQKALAGLRDFRGVHSDRPRSRAGQRALTVLRYEQDEIRQVGSVDAGAGEEGAGSGGPKR